MRPRRSRQVCSLSHRLPPRRRRSHGALQLALRAPARRHVRAPHRGHRRRAVVVGDGHRHRRRPAVAGPRLGRRDRTSAGRTRRTSSRERLDGIARWPTGSSPRATPTTATARPRRCSRSARRRRPRRGVDVRPHLSRALAAARSRRSRRRARRAPSASRCRRADARSTIACADRIDVRQRQHRGLRRPAFRRPSHLSPHGRRRRCRHGDHATSSVATITSRTRRSRCCSTRRSARRRRASRTCRSSWAPTRNG